MDTPISPIPNPRSLKSIHNKLAPYWAGALVIFGILGISTTWIKTGGFWNGYVLDICGPGWNYILFRLLFTEYRENKWTRFFTPLRTLVIFLLVAGGIEMMQYFEVYDSTYDPWDLLAYVSLLLPLFFVDILVRRKSRRS